MACPVDERSPGFWFGARQSTPSSPSGSMLSGRRVFLHGAFVTQSLGARGLSPLQHAAFRAPRLRAEVASVADQLRQAACAFKTTWTIR
jgi:hypothetical protein